MWEESDRDDKKEEIFGNGREFRKAFTAITVHVAHIFVDTEYPWLLKSLVCNVTVS